MANQSALVIEGLARPGLAPVDCRVEAGESMAVRGPSGSGKSLFLRAVADLDPNDGRVTLGAMDRAKTPAPLWRRSVAYLHPDAGWWADTVAPHFDDWAAAAPLAEQFGLPAVAGDWEVVRLSTGEKQRLALVRLLLSAPPVMLLDEPTSALDADAAAAVEAYLRERLADGAILLMATHDAGQAERMARRTLRFAGGVAAETPDALPDGLSDGREARP